MCLFIDEHFSSGNEAVLSPEIELHHYQQLGTPSCPHVKYAGTTLRQQSDANSHLSDSTIW